MTIAHQDYLADMYKQKSVVYSGPLEKIGGLVVYESESKMDAIRLVELDPFISGKFRDYEIYEWKQTLGL